MKDIKSEIINTTEQGINLCREGSISILTVLIDTDAPTVRVCIIDVHVMGTKAFETSGKEAKSLKDILQDEHVPKVFFDVRNDSDALFAHFGVALQGVDDLQLMESVGRSTTRSRKYLNGLAKCVKDYVPGSTKDWELTKEKGKRLFEAGDDGSCEILNQRPIVDEVISYCIGDVRYLPQLWDRFRCTVWVRRDMVNDETKKRIVLSQRQEYEPHGPNRTLAPWSQSQNVELDRSHPVPARDLEDYLDDYFHNDDGLDDFDDWDYGEDNDFEDWTRAAWQGPPS